MGVWSSLKSPVWRTLPAGVLRKTPKLAGIECVIAKKQISNAPRRTHMSSCTSWNTGLWMRCSASLPAMSPSVSALENTGTFGFRSSSRYGRAPVWSS